ncbi:hydroxyacylglutathione hydrolase [Chitinolyticbacter albus]|uniref:hydroxyacylglutathione hydrolase n=1 Tax=Chitinolyticbacter albus TaxID=2961951 RepID=UPI002108CDA0|nr:hydroxyacylglutathione hydrolase [Chitinolyticbacter albus]
MLQLEALPILEDNYIWVLHDGRQALAVDPGRGEPLLAWLHARGLTLEAVLITHHHWDHVEGLPVLLATQPGLTIYGPASVAVVNQPLAGGETIAVLGLSFTVLPVPGHTLDHLAYYGAPWLFCGDTLFGAGCGRLFEGTPAQMHASLSSLAALPGETLVCCTHEYTLINLRFAREVDPDNAALADRWRRDVARRERGEPTLPGSITEERATNPFLRACEAALQTVTGTPGDALATFAALRARRNGFR